MMWLVRCYPKRWRLRYGAELEELVRDLRPSRPGAALALDLAKGAIRAHLHQGVTMTEVQRCVIARVCVIVGIVWVLLSTEIWLTNVAFPSTSDDEAVPVLLSYLGVFAALFITGVVARRAGATRRGQVLAGLLAGLSVGLLIAASFAIVDNVWLDVVAQQQTKIEGFSHSTAASMRDFINEGLVGVAVFLSAALAVVGALLGLAGGLAGDRTARPNR